MRRIDGVAVGLVSEVDAKLGRVKVKFPWMDPPQASYWAPIASLLSGKKRGARFMPELEDEALIAFDRGAFDHPYVIGFLWNGADEAPDDVKSNRLVVTPGGHELRFEDKAGDRRVVLKTAAGHNLTLDDKNGTVTLATKSGAKVTLDDQPGKAVVEASQNTITIGPTGVTLEVITGTLNIKSTAVTNVEAQGAMNIKASGLVNLNAGLLNVTTPMATFSGVVQATTVMATSIVASSYTPGAGNIW
jgi:uncharacterized protein involved in type VI secretion and phage assembly